MGSINVVAHPHPQFVQVFPTGMFSSMDFISCPHFSHKIFSFITFTSGIKFFEFAIYFSYIPVFIIKQVKNAVKVPVIGNGDIISPQAAKNMFDYTGVDGIMIARGSVGNPWIFRNIIEYLENDDLIEEPTVYNSSSMTINRS